MTETSYMQETLQNLKKLVHPTSDINDCNSILNNFVKELPDLINSERASIFIHDPFNQRAWLQSGTGLIEKELDIPLRGSITGEVIFSKKYLIINDMSTREGIHKAVDLMTGFSTKSVLCVPILSQSGSVRGTLQALNKKNGDIFIEKDRILLEQIAAMLHGPVRVIFNAQREKTVRSKGWRERIQNFLPF
ncbi:MAG: GAF domain-containing protein [Magnetococcus sp. DMHC-6]